MLGAKPAGDPIPVSEVRTVSNKQPLVVRGEVVTKCPTAGCWFDLRDGGETIRVSSKNAGWVINDVPLHTKVTVAGRRDGSADEPSIEASGLAY